MQNRYLAWKYKQEVIITDSKTTEGYQATLVLQYKPGMRGDFRDIRFSDKHGNPLYIFIDPPVFAISARIWVRLPANDTLIYIYWGNGAAADASNGAAVFEFWDDFNTLNLKNQWTVVGGAASVANSILTLYSDTKNCMIRSTITYGAEYALEFRMRHQSTNKTMCGYWSTSQNMACWLGTYTAHTTSYDDHMYTKDGASATGVDDGINRGGSAYYIYGIVNAPNAPIFTVDYQNRGIVLLTPPSGDLPIGFYSEYGKTLEIDWVRVRKYETAKPGMTLGKRWTTNPKTYPWFDMLGGVSTTAMSTDIVCDDTTSCSVTTEMRGLTLLRQRLYYRPEDRSAYNGWKYKGDISVASPSIVPVRIDLKPLPGMTLDCRDIRFSDPHNKKLSYYIEYNTEAGFYYCFVSNPENYKTIHVHYGHAVSKSESNISVISTVDVNDNIIFYNPDVKGAYSRWKYKGNIHINTESGPATVQIPFSPGMAVDGRDIRFSDVNGKELSYYLDPDGISSRVFIFDVEQQTHGSTINFYYGHAVSNSESDISVKTGTSEGRNQYFQVLSSGKLNKWKYKGDLEIDSLTLGDIKVPVNIPLLPGMAEDGRDIRFSDVNGKELAYYIDPFSIVDNSDFEAGLPANTLTGDTAIVQSSTYRRSGIYSMRVISTNAATDNCILVNQNILPLISNTQYYWEVYVYSPDGATISPSRLFLQEAGGSWRAIATGAINGNSADQSLPAGVWVKVCGTGTTNSDWYAHSRLVLRPAEVGGAFDTTHYIYYDDLRVFPITSAWAYGDISCWVLWPANTYKINYYYGNHSVVSKSNVSAFSGLSTGYPDFLPAIEIDGIYRKWKYKGDISISNETIAGEQIQIRIPFYPGMAVDGRDIRFTDAKGNELPYYIESFVSNVFTCWIKCTVGITTIHFYYGNGLVVSRSDPTNVFDFWDDFPTLDSGVWSTFSGTPTVSNGTAVLGGTATTAIRSIRTFGNDTICEMKMYHPVGNKSLCGYWGVGNLREVWEGGFGSFNNDYMHTYNGSTQTNTSGGVDRGGSTYYVYGIAYLSTGPLYYVNYEYIGQITTNLPSGNLPIALYSTANFGNVVVDWVRVRKYSINTAQVLRHSPQFNNSMPYINDRKINVVGHSLAKTTLGYYTVPYSNTVLNHTPQLNTTSYYREPSQSIISRHSPQLPSTHYYFDYISVGAHTEMHGEEPTFIERVELSQFSMISVDISRSINDSYVQLVGEFANDMVPYEGAIVKYYTTDINGIKTLVFIGKVVANSPTVGYMGTTVNMIATDNSRNLIVQHINWNHQVVYLSDEIPTWSQWITEIISTQNTGVVAEKIIDILLPNKQFVFDPKVTRFEAIKKIAGYCNYVLNIKPKMYGSVMLPAFYAVPPEQIDSTINGFDLPQPVEFHWPDSTIVDKPTITNDIEEKYNTVIVYGVITSSGETTVAVAYTPSVEYGDIKPREFTINDNSIEEKGSSAEIEAIKWLLYFSSPRATVTVRFTKRLDFELYQRIRFGSGFAKALQDLTFTEQLKHVVAYDPRDESNTKHIVDVSGVPRPHWLRVTDIKYHRENIDEYIELKAITDFIYSIEDETVDYPYSTYISPGYIKPVLEDSTSMTQSIVSSAIDKQLSPEICTVVSISTDESTAVVQTQSGKLITVRLK